MVDLLQIGWPFLRYIGFNLNLLFCSTGGGMNGPARCLLSKELYFLTNIWLEILKSPVYMFIELILKYLIFVINIDLYDQSTNTTVSPIETSLRSNENLEVT